MLYRSGVCSLRPTFVRLQSLVQRLPSLLPELFGFTLSPRVEFLLCGPPGFVALCRCLVGAGGDEARHDW